MKELEKRNLVSTIRECLEEHKVTLLDKDGSDAQMYLVMVSAPGTASADFIDTYAGELDDFKARMADSVLDKRTTKQVYGVLIDTDLKYAFAFNRLFADLDRDQKRIVFKDHEKVLLDIISGDDLTDAMPDFIHIAETGFAEEIDDVEMRYAIIGKKKGSQAKQAEVTFERPSLLSRVSDLWKPHNVMVYVGEKLMPFYMVTTSYQTDASVDFKRTYPETTKFTKKLAEKVIGGKRRNNYTLLISPDMQIKYVFNQIFASRDLETCDIRYADPEKVLLDATSSKMTDLSTLNKPQVYRPRPNLHDMVLRYAVQGKK